MLLTALRTDRTLCCYLVCHSCLFPDAITMLETHQCTLPSNHPCPIEGSCTPLIKLLLTTHLSHLITGSS